MLQIGTWYITRVPFGYIFVKKEASVTAKDNLSREQKSTAGMGPAVLSREKVGVA